MLNSNLYEPLVLDFDQREAGSFFNYDPDNLGLSEIPVNSSGDTRVESDELEAFRLSQAIKSWREDLI